MTNFEIFLYDSQHLAGGKISELIKICAWAERGKISINSPPPISYDLIGNNICRSEKENNYHITADFQMGAGGSAEIFYYKNHISEAWIKFLRCIKCLNSFL